MEIIKITKVISRYQIICKKIFTYFPKLKIDGLLPPSGVCGTGAPGAPNIRLGDPGEGAKFRKFPALGKALKALPPDEDTTGAVPKFKRSPSWLVNPPKGSWCTLGGNIEVGGGGLGVGLTGPTGGPALPLPGAEEAGVLFLGGNWTTRFCPLAIIAMMGSLRSLEVKAGATAWRQCKMMAMDSLGRLDFRTASSFKGPCNIDGIFRCK